MTLSYLGNTHSIIAIRGNGTIRDLGLFLTEDLLRLRPIIKYQNMTTEMFGRKVQIHRRSIIAEALCDLAGSNQSIIFNWPSGAPMGHETELYSTVAYNPV